MTKSSSTFPISGIWKTRSAAYSVLEAKDSIELDPKYVDVIIDRWETLTGEKAIKLVEGKGNED